MKRALMTATVPSMIGQFNMNNIKLLQELGYKVDIACNFDDHSVWSPEKIVSLKKTLDELNVHMYQIDFTRSFFGIKQHVKSYKQMKKLINERKYDLIHTHTPISSIITRIAFKNSHIFNKCRMIYTAHGFHFFKGNNPLKNFLFRNIERYGARYTDTLITINKEDYEAAKKFKLRKNGTVEYVPGVGIDLDKINSIQGNREKIINDLDISKDSILLLSVGELSKRKNHESMIKALAHLPNNFHYLICGQGQLKRYLIELATKNSVEDHLHFLGYCPNIIEIMKSCQLFIFPSLQEGLPVALMEAIACQLPCIASNIRGNCDLLSGNYNSRLFDLKKDDLAGIILNLVNNHNQDQHEKNETILKLISKNNIKKIMTDIYKEESYAKN